MLYRVIIDGVDMLDYNDPGLVLLAPQVEVELDTSGSFEFTVPPNHLHYDDFTPESIMKMTIEVWEDSILHWFGRPIEYHLDFYKNKKINCEGGLAYFNDSVIRSEEWDQTSLSTIFDAVIAEHNSMVPSNRQFSVGNFTVSDRPVYRKFNYEQTFDVLKSKFLDAEEGHFFVRRENGVNYIDFLKDMPYTCNQDVEFAENLLNFTYNFDGKDFATCVIPLGGTDQETGEPINIRSVNGGSDILVGNSAANYGNIVRVQQYSDIEDPSELVAEGQKYLTTLQYNAFLIECSAVDLHSKDGTQQQFRVGQMVNCISNPHGIQLELPISKMTLYLDSAAKQITLGRIPKKTLSRFYKDKVNDYNDYDYDYDDGVPDGWTVVPPETDGGEPTLKKVPITIKITQQPSQLNYTQESSIFSITGLEVKAVEKLIPITYLNDERYVNGVIPYNELSFIASNGTQYYNLIPGQTNILSLHKAKIQVIVRWTCPYNNKKHIASFYIIDKVQEAIEDSMVPASLVMVKPPAQLEYFTGCYIHLSGAKFVAYLENGQPYTGNGYEGGVVPNSELVLDPKIADREQAYRGGTVEFEGYGYEKYSVSWCDPAAGFVKFITDRAGPTIKEISYGYASVSGEAPIYCVNLSDENGPFLNYISSKPFTGTYKGWYEDRPEQIDATELHYTQSFVIDGEVVGKVVPYYHAGGPGLNPDTPGMTCNPSITNTGSGWDWLDRAVWALLDSEESGAIDQDAKVQTINVSWTTPQGTTLSTSFEIKIKPSEHGR